MKAKEKALLDKIHKLEHERNLLKEPLKESLKELSVLKAEKSRLEEENARLNDWVDRLLEYTEMSKEDLQMLINKEKSMDNLVKMFEFSNRRFF